MDVNKSSKKHKHKRIALSSSPEIRIQKTHSKSKRKKKYSSSSSSNSSDEWEEKHPTPNLEPQCGSSSARDEWMSIDTLVPTTERQKKVEKKEVNRSIIANPGQTDRELNPYWKDGGTGLPSEEKDLHVSSSSVGDRGLEWYQRAFKRAQETAKEENRSLEEVVSERWGSLDKLKALILAAESKQGQRGRDKYRDRRDHRHSHRDRDRRENVGSSDSRFRKPESSSGRHRERHTQTTDDRSKAGFHRPEDDLEPVPKARFLKPGEGTNRETVSYEFRDDRKRKWMKPDAKLKCENADRERGGTSLDLGQSSEQGQKDVTEDDNRRDERESSSSKAKNDETKLLSDDQINALAAKLVKAEIMGNAALVEKLKVKLELARSNREAEKQKGGSSVKEETIVLLQTNQKGLTRPLEGPLTREPTGGRRKKHNVATHVDGQRVRYFADDDNRDLKDMFEREKLGTMDDDKEMFLKLAARKKPGAGSDEEDAAFTDAARVKESDGRIQERERNKAIREETRRRKTIDGCSWCLENKARLKHLVVSIGETCYLCLPSEESLTPLHCLIVPIQHSTCGTLLDEDVWEEIHKFRKAIAAMASSKEQDVIFFEQAIGLRNGPHMVLHCVLLDKEVGDLAPIYFKKAILDSETEWANNKKVVDIKGLDVRRSVPKGLPYFAVEFPPSGGFAHVIEDEKYFPKNFAQEIIGGMLDLDHRKWRKPQKLSFVAQREKTAAFSKEWSQFNITKEKKQRSSSSSSVSSSDSD